MNEVRIKATADTRQAEQSVAGLRKQWQDFSKDGVKIGAAAAVTAKGLDIIGASAYGAGR